MNSMIACVFFFALSYTSIAEIGVERMTPGEFYLKHMQEADLKCRKVHGVTVEEEALAMETRITPYKIKCFHRCIHETLNLITEGLFNRDAFAEIVKDLIGIDNARELIKECQPSTPNTDPCEYSSQILVCFRDAMVKYL